MALFLVKAKHRAGAEMTAVFTGESEMAVVAVARANDFFPYSVIANPNKRKCKGVLPFDEFLESFEDSIQLKARKEEDEELFQQNKSTEPREESSQLKTKKEEEKMLFQQHMATELREESSRSTHEDERPSLAICPACRATVSEDAFACPKCGQPFKEQPQKMSSCGLFFIIVAAIVFAALVITIGL